MNIDCPQDFREAEAPLKMNGLQFIQTEIMTSSSYYVGGASASLDVVQSVSPLLLFLFLLEKRQPLTTIA